MADTASRPRHSAVVKRIHDSRESGGGGSPLGAIRAVVVGVFALLGLVCFAIVAMPLLGFQLVVLTSGSMSPGLPAGSIVVVRDVAASEVEVGDIVTVDRPGKPPVTHRVIATEGGAGTGGGRILTLQGDGNATPDPEPYRVERVGEAALALPWGGRLVFAMRSPWAIGGAAVVVALLVLWVWWPRREEP